MVDRYVPLYLYLEDDVFLQLPQKIETKDEEETYCEIVIFDENKES